MKIRVAFVQTKPVFLAVEANLARAEKMVRAVNADLIVLPEFFNCGYNFKSKKEAASAAESISEGPTVGLLRGLAMQKKAAIVAGLVEKEGGKIYNSAVFVTPNTVKVYRKTHLFAREKEFFSPGNLGYKVFPWKGAKIGVMICFDWFFPEAARTLALKGADIIAHPSNLVLPYCPEAMKTRCLENRVFAVTANRVGRERDLTYIGRSQITGVRGEILVRASATAEESRVAVIDPAKARDKKLNPWNRLLFDRRTRFYHA